MHAAVKIMAIKPTTINKNSITIKINFNTSIDEQKNQLLYLLTATVNVSAIKKAIFSLRLYSLLMLFGIELHRLEWMAVVVEANRCGGGREKFVEGRTGEKNEI